MWDPIVTGEGPGERSYRCRLGLPLSSPGVTERIDVIEMGHEVKCVDGKRWDPRLRFGAVGIQAWGNLVSQLDLREDSSDLANGIRIGEVTVKMLREGDENLTLKIKNDLLASHVLGQKYGAIVLVSPAGFLVIPGRDYDRALVLERVSQGSPRYRFKCHEYCRERLGEDCPGT